MRKKVKSNSLRLALRLVVGLTTGIFVLSVSVILNAGGFHSHKGWKWKGASPSCGDTITTYTSLFTDLDCSEYSEGAALTIETGAELNLNGKKVIGNINIICIDIRGHNTKVWNGTVTHCSDGVVIAGTGRHRVFKMRSMDNEGSGFIVEGNSNGNWLENNEALRNKAENFLIEVESDGNQLIKNKAENGDDRGFYVRGSNNRLYKNKADKNRDDALRIRNGINNKAIDNIFIGTESGEGIEIDAEDNIARRNIIIHNNRGIRIRKDGNTVKENIILNNLLQGIRVESSANLISRNIIEHNGFEINEEGIEVFNDGMKLETETADNTLTRNLVFNNGANGINVDNGSTENKMKQNIAMQNGVDDTYFDALDGNLPPECGSNIWCKNYFGTKYPEDCIDSEDCGVGDDGGWRIDDGEDND